jgi:hypothetical protein
MRSQKKTLLSMTAFMLVASMTFIGMVSRCEASIKALFLGFDNNVSAVKSDILGPTGSDPRFDYANSSYLQQPASVSLATLQAYDAVLVWTANLPSSGLGDTLADYVDAGGGVVLATFDGWMEAQGYFPGRIHSPGYNPLTSPTTDAYQFSSLGAYDPLHPIMSGVSALTSSFYNRDYFAVDADATLVASWSTGRPLAATNASGDVVNITLFPNVVTHGHATGNYDELFRNALAYAADPLAVAAVPEAASIAIWGGLALTAGAIRWRREHRKGEVQ